MAKDTFQGPILGKHHLPSCPRHFLAALGHRNRFRYTYIPHCQPLPGASVASLLEQVHRGGGSVQHAHGWSGLHGAGPLQRSYIPYLLPQVIQRNVRLRHGDKMSASTSMPETPPVT